MVELASLRLSESPQSPATTAKFDSLSGGNRGRWTEAQSQLNHKVEPPLCAINGHPEWVGMDNPKESLLDLRDATVDSIKDDAKSWPRQGQLMLDGLRFERFQRLNHRRPFAFALATTRCNTTCTGLSSTQPGLPVGQTSCNVAAPTMPVAAFSRTERSREGQSSALIREDSLKGLALVQASESASAILHSLRCL